MPASRDPLAAYWPLAGLRLTTPRLQLTPVADPDLVGLIELALAGIHDPAAMPFAVPWTDAAPDVLPAEMLRHYWTTRAQARPERWSIEFAVRHRGEIVGTQAIGAKDFAVTRAVESGSWLGRAFHGSGIGTEMRFAVVDFAFDHLKATRAQSAAFADNAASARVSEKLGYAPNGTVVVRRRPGEAALERNLVVTPETLIRPDWRVQVSGLEPCLPFLGLAD